VVADECCLQFIPTLYTVYGGNEENRNAGIRGATRVVESSR